MKKKKHKLICPCGKKLSQVKKNKTPFEFCSIYCKNYSISKRIIRRLLKTCELNLQEMEEETVEAIHEAASFLQVNK